MSAEDRDSTGRALIEDARARGYQGAEAVYRSLAVLRDSLPADVQIQLAIMLEWARDGLDRQISENNTPELVALHAAYTFARDVLLGVALRGGR